MKFLKDFFNPPLPSPEEWAQQHAGKTTPDKILAEYIINDIAKNFSVEISNGANCS